MTNVARSTTDIARAELRLARAERILRDDADG